MSLRKDIRARRIELGLRQRDVARHAGVSETLLRKWERGLGIPPEAQLARIADILTSKTIDLAAAQKELMAAATPGEGYTTARAGDGHVVEPREAVPAGKRRVLDLFCGAGGLSFGIEQSGEFVTTCGIDLLPDRIDTFVRNHAYAKGIAGDLTSFSLDSLADVVGAVDLVVGGPPCQGFSSIRPFRTLTEGDPRNSLIEHYVLVISKLKPQWFVFENVVGILRHEKGARLTALLGGLEAVGYAVDWRVINAALFGVPQYRERVVIVGNRDGCQFVWPEPTCHCDYKGMAGRRPAVMRAHPLFSIGLPSHCLSWRRLEICRKSKLAGRPTSTQPNPRTTTSAG